DERLTAAPAVRVGVVVGLLPDEDRALPLGPAGQRAAAVLEVGDDRPVRLEDLHPRVVGDLGGEAAAVVDGDDGADARGRGDRHVVLTEGGRLVDEAGAVLGGDVVGGEDRPHPLPEALAAGEVVEDGRVAAAGELRAGGARDDVTRLAELAGVGGDAGGG